MQLQTLKQALADKDQNVKQYVPVQQMSLQSGVDALIHFHALFTLS